MSHCVQRLELQIECALFRIIRKLSRNSQYRSRLSAAHRAHCPSETRGVRGPGSLDVQRAVESHQENFDVGLERLLEEFEELLVDRLAVGLLRGGLVHEE